MRRQILIPGATSNKVIASIALVCAAAAIAGGLLVLCLVRAAAPSRGHQPAGPRQAAEPEAAEPEAVQAH